MHPKEILIKLLKWFGGDTRQTIVGYIVLAVIAAGGGILSLSKTALNFLLHLLNTPSPLWVTIVISLLCLLYIESIKNKNAKSHSSHKSPDYKIEYFTIWKYKWKTKIYDHGYFEVDKYPYCAIHDLRFIFGNNKKYCPGTEKEKCNNSLGSHDEFTTYEAAKSIIENKIKTRCQQSH